MKVLHILYQSLPQVSGSSIRSRDILMSQKEVGLEVVAISSPFQIGSKFTEYFNDIKYYRTKINNIDSISDSRKSLFKRILRLFQIVSFTKKIKKIILLEKPDVLHAHAMFFCGLPALYLGKNFNIPVVYEVRSLWMLIKDGKRQNWFSKLIEKQILGIELFVMRRSDIVIAINENLKLFLIECNISEEKIKVVGNAVNTTLIDSLKNKLKKKAKRELNFGYVGTLTSYEGLELLINAFFSFNKNFTNSQLFIYGKGIEENKIMELSKTNKNIHFCGPIKPNRVYQAFSNIDIIVNPRYKNKLTNSVTPLKPLEALAYSKIFIGSDVGGIKELIKDNVNGFLFEAGNQKSLENLMIKVYESDEQVLKKIRTEGLQYVRNNKSWLQNAIKYKKEYEHLCETSY